MNKISVRGVGRHMSVMASTGKYVPVSSMTDDHVVNLMAVWADRLARLYKLSNFTESSQVLEIIADIELGIRKCDRALIARLDKRTVEEL